MTKVTASESPEKRERATTEVTASESPETQDITEIARWLLFAFLVLASCVHLRTFWGYFGINIFPYLSANDVIVVAAEAVLPVGLLTIYVVSFRWLGKYLELAPLRSRPIRGDASKQQTVSKMLSGNFAQLLVLVITANLFFWFAIAIAREPEQIRNNALYFYAVQGAASVSLLMATFAVLSKDTDLTVATATVLILFLQTSISTSAARAVDRGSRYQYISETSVSPDGSETSVSPDARRLRYLGKAGDQYFFLPEKTKGTDDDSVVIKRSSDIKDLALYSHRQD